MPTKFELAEYLINLHAIMSAQEETGGLMKSRLLVDEYNKQWGVLKSIIEKENEDEARPKSNAPRIDETRTDSPRDQPSRGL